MNPRHICHFVTLAAIQIQAHRFESDIPFPRVIALSLPVGADSGSDSAESDTRDKCDTPRTALAVTS